MKTLLTAAALAATVAAPGVAQTLTRTDEIRSPTEVFVLALAPTGRELAAICKGNTLRTFATADGRAHLTIQGGATPMVSATYSGDGKRIAVANASGQVRVLDATSGAPIRSLKPSSAPAYLVALSMEGHLLAVAPAGEPVQLWDVDRATRIGSLENPFGSSSSLAFSSNSALLASADNDAVVRVYDAITGKERSRYEALLMESFSVAFSPDSKRLAVGGADRVLAVLDPLTGRELHRLSALKDLIGSVTILADGNTVIAVTFNAQHMSEGKDTVVWDVLTGTTHVVASGKPFAAGVPLVDGGLMLATVDKTVVTLWNLR